MASRKLQIPSGMQDTLPGECARWNWTDDPWPWDYQPLKEYITNPNFKLGAAVDAKEFNKGEIISQLVKSNFSEVVAGNAMKHASVVGNKGEMNLSTIRTFVQNVSDAELNLYGHTLVWHSQQNTRYLNSVIADKVDENYTPELTPVIKTESRTCLKVDAADMKANPWDSQFFIYFPGVKFATGDTWAIKMNVRADKEATVGTQTHNKPSEYIHWAAIGSVPFTPEWTEYTAEGTMTAEQNGGSTFAFNLNDFKEANTYYFDDLSFTLNGKELMKNGSCDDPAGTENFVSVYDQGSQKPTTIVDKYIVEVIPSGGGIPLTPEEKKDTLSWALGTWIDGMMDACSGKVKAWDLINEAVAGADFDGDGDYDLQHAENVSEDEQAANFYWQDYLGDVDFVRIAASKARRAFKTYGGEGNLLLFVNDYNLESTWDDNKKLKSLINWIKKWECDTVKIDGIGTQMHISFNENAEAQKKQEECVVNMFKLMAATGKLVRVSELDMGYKDKNGNTLMTSDLTVEQHKQMSAFYTFIIKKYFELVPENQQYGICQWCITDSPSGSSWRAGEPVGLWDSNYNRKHTYGGFAEGLKK